MSDLFITNDFIDDCADASLTLKLFHARFNRPEAVAGNDNFSVAQYNSTWVDNNQSGSTPVIITGNDFLATYINNDHSSLIVKVPYIVNVDQQLVGYLMYRRYRGNQIVDTQESSRDRVAFVFSIADFGVGIYRQQSSNTVSPSGNAPSPSSNIPSENGNDNSYIYIDISKLNIVANLEPFYNQTKDSTQESATLWNYVNEHAHDLFGMTYTTISGTNEPNFTLENKQGYFFDASTEKYSAQKTALHFSNKVTALTLPVAIYSGSGEEDVSYVASITSDDYRNNSLIQTTDGRVRIGNLMQTTINGNIVNPTKVEVDKTSDLKVTFNDTTYPEYVKKLYVEGHHVDLDDQYLFWNNG